MSFSEIFVLSRIAWTPILSVQMAQTFLIHLRLPISYSGGKPLGKEIEAAEMITATSN